MWFTWGCHVPPRKSVIRGSLLTVTNFNDIFLEYSNPLQGALFDMTVLGLMTFLERVVSGDLIRGNLPLKIMHQKNNTGKNVSKKHASSFLELAIQARGCNFHCNMPQG